MVVGAFVALLLIDVHFPDAHSLKGKRKELSSLKAQLQTRLGASVSEVGGQDTWQRSTLAAAVTAGSFHGAQLRADEIQRWLDARLPAGVRVERAVTSFEEVVG